MTFKFKIHTSQKCSKLKYLLKYISYNSHSFILTKKETRSSETSVNSVPEHAMSPLKKVIIIPDTGTKIRNRTRVKGNYC
jgi:hypothetical protein